MAFGGAIAFAAPAAATAPGADPNDPSAAQGQILQLPIGLLGSSIDVAALGHTLTSNPGGPGADNGALDLGVLGGALTIDLGDGINIPLLTDGTTPGLLNLGDLGAAQSYSESPSVTSSLAASGLITEDGGIDVGGIGSSVDPAHIDLTDLFGQLGIDTLTDQLLDQASLSVGALASTASSDAGTLTSEYAIAGLGLDLHSPTVAGLTDVVDTAVGTALLPIEALIGPDGQIEQLVDGVLSVIDALPLTNAELNALSLDTQPLTDEVRDVLLNEPLSNTDGSLVIDLSTGTIHVDLAELVVDRTGATSLNSLDPNTPVLDDAVVNGILDGITDAVTGAGENSLISKVVDVVTQGLYNVELTVDIQADISLPIVGPLVNAPVTVIGSIGGFLGMDGFAAPVIDTSQINVAGIPVGTVLQPIIDALSGLVTDIGGALEPVVTNVIDQLQPTLMGVVQPIVTGLLDNAIEPVLNSIVAITINEQPTEAPISGTGDLPGDSFTVRALSVELLPAINAIKLDLGSSTVKALAALTPTITGTDPVQAGTSLPVAGDGWAPGTQVTIELRDGTGTVVGTPVTVTVEPDGSLPAGTAYPVPADAVPGDYTLVGTQVDDPTVTAQDTVTVTAGDPGDVNTNASASAAASADADSDANPAAQVAAQAAALADATSTASAAADATASAAAQAAATATASTNASTDATTDATASATAAAQAAANADNTANTAAEASAAATANTAAAADAAAIATASADASSAAAADSSARGAPDGTADASSTASATSSATATADATASATSAATASATSSATASATSSASASANGTATANGKPLPPTGADVPLGLLALGGLLVMLGIGAAVLGVAKRRATADVE
ncbi:choice-of-anchor G family protein [Microbacterium resistens]|uniref:choice-of-anchor G family protein n=3 Tax=Microbacterium TaxID=33882 RepID=UPI00366A8C34